MKRGKNGPIDSTSPALSPFSLVYGLLGFGYVYSSHCFSHSCSQILARKLNQTPLVVITQKQKQTQCVHIGVVGVDVDVADLASASACFAGLQT